MYALFQENELITLSIGSGILVFLLVNFRKLREVVPLFSLLFLSFIFLYFGELAANLQPFLWPQQFNLLKHFGDALNMGFLAVWVYGIFYRSRSLS